MFKLKKGDYNPTGTPAALFTKNITINIYGKHKHKIMNSFTKNYDNLKCKIYRKYQPLYVSVN